MSAYGRSVVEPKTIPLISGCCARIRGYPRIVEEPIPDRHTPEYPTQTGGLHLQVDQSI